MLKFSNEDYSVPRERMRYQTGNGCNDTMRSDMGKFRCDGTRNTDMTGTCGVKLPTTCAIAALASVYSPYQEYTELFDSMTALCNGTLFKELYKPLMGGGCNG